MIIFRQKFILTISVKTQTVLCIWYFYIKKTHENILFLVFFLYIYIFSQRISQSFIVTMSNYTDYLRHLYYTPGNQGALSGPEKLYQAVKEDGKYKISRAKIKQFLNNEDAYSLLKFIRQTFPRSMVVVNMIDSMWDGYLADVSNISSHNDGFKFLLVLIDIFSRFLFIIPLKSKQHQNIINGLKIIFQKGRKPNTLRTDRVVNLKIAGLRHF